MKSLVLLLLILMSCFAYTSCQYHIKKYNLSGAWVEQNNSPEQLVIINDTINIDVVHGQININALLKKDGDTILVYFLKPSYLGMGGARLPWKITSKTKKIATITNVKSDSFIFCWYGFYDELKNEIFFRECPFGNKTTFIRRVD